MMPSFSKSGLVCGNGLARPIIADIAWWLLPIVSNIPTTAG
jgi:hypothetical protein